MIYAIMSLSVLVVAVLFGWINALNRKIATLQDAFDGYLENEERVAKREKECQGKDILIRYDRDWFWDSNCKEGCVYISYGQAIALIREHLGLVYDYVEGSKGYTRLVPKPEPEEEKDD